MGKKILKKLTMILLYLFLAGLVLIVLARVATGVLAANKTYTESAVPTRRVGIVFGAGLWRDGSPTPILQDRVETGAQL